MKSLWSLLSRVLPLESPLETATRVIEAAAEQSFAVDHDALIALRHQLVDHRAFHGRHVTVLDQVFVAERLLELAHLELKFLPVVDIHVGVGDDSATVVPAKSGNKRNS